MAARKEIAAKLSFHDFPLALPRAAY